MVPEFVCCPAAATGCRHCLPAIRRESCGFEETSRSNLWRLVSCAIRRQQVEPGTARRQRRQEFSGNPGKPKNSGTPIYGPRIRVLSGGSNRVQALPARNPQGILRIRRNQPLQFMAAGFVCYSAAASGTGHCPAAAPTGVFRESRKTEEFGDSNLWSPNSCAVRRQQVEPGTVRRQQVGAGSACPVSRAYRPRRGRRSRRAPGPRCSRRPDGCSTRSRRRARRGPRGRWRARWWRSGAACRPAWGS